MIQRDIVAFYLRYLILNVFAHIKHIFIDINFLTMHINKHIHTIKRIHYHHYVYIYIYIIHTELQAISK